MQKQKSITIPELSASFSYSNLSGGTHRDYIFTPILTNTTSSTTGTWDFGDGANIISTTSQAYAFCSGGYYTVSLQVTDDCETVTATRTVNVPNMNVCFTPTVNNYSVELSTSCSEYLLSGSNYFINWGDGYYNNGTNLASMPTTHTYTNGGIYTVELTLSYGCESKSATRTVNINSGAIDFTSVPDGGSCSSCSSLPCGFKFTASVINPPPDATIKYAWNFGDGSTTTLFSSSDNTCHDFSTSGTFYVTLYVDIDGNIIQQTKPVVVPEFTATPNLYQGLLAHYSFDAVDYNATNNTLADITGNGYTLDYYPTSGAPTFQYGHQFTPSSTIHFDGNDYLEEKNAGITTQINNNDYSFSFWLKYDDNHPQSADVLWIGSDSFVSHDFNNSEITVWSTQYSLPAKLSSWHHFIITYNKTDSKISVYCNGEFIDSANNSPIISGKLSISDNSGSTYEGRVDNMRIYNRVLNTAEIQALFAE